jgi:hypothetical protein
MSLTVARAVPADGKADGTHASKLLDDSPRQLCHS